VLDRRAALMAVRIAEKSAISTPMRAKMVGFDQDMASLSCLYRKNFFVAAQKMFARSANVCAVEKGLFEKHHNILRMRKIFRRNRLQSAAIFDLAAWYVLSRFIAQYLFIT
jgi:hypothetical protein